MLKEIIKDYECGTWTFSLLGKEGLISWAPVRGKTHIHYGYIEEEEEPEFVGDFDSVMLAVNLFMINGRRLIDYSDQIQMKPLVDNL